MLSFEICNKLKKAGFPQKSNLTVLDADCTHWGALKEYTKEYSLNCKCIACVPTLSELILICQDKFSDEGNQFYLGFEKHGDLWQCVSNAYGVSEWGVFGKTLEESVANLYLKLKESKG